MPEEHSFFEEKEFIISIITILVVGTFLIWFFFFRTPSMDVEKPLTPEEKQQLLENLSNDTTLPGEDKKAILESISSESTLTKEDKTKLLGGLSNDAE